MATTDARPVPRKNAAYRVTFPILDADGDLVTAAAGLDTEISKDGGTFTDCTNEATEIATASGMYFLDLTSTEMNADTVTIIVKTTTSGAKTTPIVLYPEQESSWSMIADAILDRDMSLGIDSGSTTFRTMRQALRFLRNKWSISGTTLTVTKENDTTASWTSTITATPGADPITGNDPAG
jgi:hypothetical protein